MSPRSITQHDRRDGRLQRLPLRPPGRRDRGSDPVATRSPSETAWTTTITSGSGRRSTRRSPSTRTGCCCTVARRTAQNASQRAGPTPRRDTGRLQAELEQTRESRPVPPRMETISAGSFALTARFIVTGRFCRFLIRTATPPVRRSPDNRSRGIGGGSFCSHPTALPRRP